MEIEVVKQYSQALPCGHGPMSESSASPQGTDTCLNYPK